MALFRKNWFTISLATILIFSLTACATTKKDSTGYWPTKEWRASSPEAQNMDSQVLKKMDSHLKNSFPKVRSAIIVRNGHIVFEEYYLGNADDTQPLFSATKSFVSALIGIAYDKGNIESIDQKVADYFPEYVGDITDEKFNEITIRHLLTMSSGFDTNMKGRSGMRQCIGFPIKFTPGSEARYNSCSSHLLSGVITKSTKMSTLEFGYQQLFEPLGIPKPNWSSGNDGYTMGGYGIYMTSRDMAKFGYLYLHNGIWEGNKIVSSNWVKESTQEQTKIKFGPNAFPYGYQFWIASVDGHSAFSAMGLGGQYISVFPDLDMVTIVTSDSRAVVPEHQGVVPKYAIASITD